MRSERIIDGRIVDRHSIHVNEAGSYVAADNDVAFMAYLHLSWALRDLGFDFDYEDAGRKVVYVWGRA